MPASKARVELSDAADLSHEHPETLLAIDQLLEELERGPEHVKNAERKALCARYALYGGLSESEIAEALDLPKSTVGADVRFARAWLLSKLSQEDNQ